MLNSHLAININYVSVRFTVWSKGLLFAEKNYTFVEQHDAMYKPQLETFWNNTGWKSTDFSEVSLSWSEKQTTLVPTNIFNESTKRDIFYLSYGRSTPSDEIDYNRLALPNVVNVYAIPFWVKSFFVIRFPKIVIQHEGTHLLRGLYAQVGRRNKSQMVLHKDHFLLACANSNEIIFYSSFDWSNERDIIYYYSFFLQQQTQTALDIPLEIGLGFDAELEKELLVKLFKEIHQNADTLHFVDNLVDKYQLLCV